jgi:L-ascorbate metabolism protein UlaG (beta-lactamase superfamily)
MRSMLRTHGARVDTADVGSASLCSASQSQGARATYGHSQGGRVASNHLVGAMRLAARSPTLAGMHRGTPRAPGSSRAVSARDGDGSLAVTWAGHATALIELDGVRILTDPVLRNRVGPLRRTAPPVSEQLAAGIDAVILSHLHSDHADIPSLRGFGENVAVLAPRGAGRWLARHGVRNVHELSRGEQAHVGSVRVAATGARHDPHRRPLGVKADPIGFMVTGSQGLYFAGDTDLFAEMSELSGSVDLALLPIAGWGPTLGPGHLDPQRALQAAAQIAPRLVIPIHWGTLAIGWPAWWARGQQRPVREFSALMVRDLPSVELRVLAPGERTVLRPPEGTSDRPKTDAQ